MIYLYIYISISIAIYIYIYIRRGRGGRWLSTSPARTFEQHGSEGGDDTLGSLAELKYVNSSSSIYQSPAPSSMCSVVGVLQLSVPKAAFTTRNIEGSM